MDSIFICILAFEALSSSYYPVLRIIFKKKDVYVMDLFSGILGGLGAAGGLISSIIGGRKAAKAAKAQQAALDRQKENESNWYARNYYQNYMDSTEAKAAIRRVNDTLARQNEQARASAVISGATPEAVQATQEAGNETLADTMAGLAAQGTSRRQAVDAQHIQNQANLSAQQQAINAQQQQGNMNLQTSGVGLIGSALSLYDNSSGLRGGITSGSETKKNNKV